MLHSLRICNPKLIVVGSERMPAFDEVRYELGGKHTGTFKLKKGNLSAEGFDPNALQDPLFFRDPAQDTYVPLTAELYEQLQNGNLRL